MDAEAARLWGRLSGAPSDVRDALPILADALTAIPEADRAAVVVHLQALAKMSPGRRSALLTLTRE